MGLLAFTLTLALTASAAPSGSAVLVTQRSGLSATEGATLRGQLERSLKASGLPLALEGHALLSRLARLGFKDVAACRGRRTCALEVGRQLGVPAVISVRVSRGAEGDSVALELIRLGDDTLVVRETFIIPRRAKGLAAQLAPFVEALRAVTAPVERHAAGTPLHEES